MRRGIRWIWVVSVVAVATFGGPEPSPAVEFNYPWCTSGAGNEFGAVNCGFSTFEQCLASARGNGQSCGQNPFYVPPSGVTTGKRTPRRGQASR